VYGVVDASGALEATATPATVFVVLIAVVQTILPDINEVPEGFRRSYCGASASRPRHVDQIRDQ
jgi:hypothetical protein